MSDRLNVATDDTGTITSITLTIDSPEALRHAEALLSPRDILAATGELRENADPQWEQQRGTIRNVVAAALRQGR